MAVTVYMMVGLPGSGKSTIAAHLAEKYFIDVYNADSIREELYGDASIQGKPAEVFGKLYMRARDDVSIGRPVILDNTNITKKVRKKAMNAFRNSDIRFVAVVMDTPIDECKARNAVRDRVVPEWVIDRMASQFQEPTLDEGFDNIVHVYDDVEEPF